MMPVSELINILSRIEDKSLPLFVKSVSGGLDPLGSVTDVRACYYGNDYEHGEWEDEEESSSQVKERGCVKGFVLQPVGGML